MCKEIHRHIIVKILKAKNKGKILKVTREKRLLTNKRTPIKLTANSLAETSIGCKAVGYRIQRAQRKNCQGRILYPGRLLFKNKGKIKTFPDKQKLRESVTSRTTSSPFDSYLYY